MRAGRRTALGERVVFRDTRGRSRGSSASTSCSPGPISRRLRASPRRSWACARATPRRRLPHAFRSARRPRKPALGAVDDGYLERVTGAVLRAPADVAAKPGAALPFAVHVNGRARCTGAGTGRCRTSPARGPVRPESSRAPDLTGAISRDVRMLELSTSRSASRCIWSAACHPTGFPDRTGSRRTTSGSCAIASRRCRAARARFR